MDVSFPFRFLLDIVIALDLRLDPLAVDSALIASITNTIIRKIFPGGPSSR